MSPTDGRKFGLTLGVAFLVLAGVLFWRDRVTIASVFIAVGSALGLAGLVIPTRLGPVQSGWLGFAHAVSRVTTPIVMSVAYFLIITPVGLVRRIAASRSLWRPARNGSFWIDTAQGSPRDMKRQF